jgi:LPXTG-motif cell wall-anchored protein
VHAQIGFLVVVGAVLMLLGTALLFWTKRKA